MAFHVGAFELCDVREPFRTGQIRVKVVPHKVFGDLGLRVSLYDTPGFAPFCQRPALPASLVALAEAAFSGFQQGADQALRTVAEMLFSCLFQGRCQLRVLCRKKSCGYSVGFR